MCVTLQSGKLQLEGTVAAGVPVLTSVQGCSFSVPACLRGPVLVFQAAPSPSLLPAVVGQFVCVCVCVCVCVSEREREIGYLLPIQP